MGGGFRGQKQFGATVFLPSPRIDGNDGRMSMKPQLLSWIVCDSVHIDPATGKQYLLGVFPSVRSRTFPFRYPRMMFVLTIAGLPEGKHSLRITLGLPMETQHTLVEREFESPGPMQKISLLSDLQGLGFETPGHYAIAIDIDNENLLVTTLPVIGPGPEANN